MPYLTTYSLRLQLQLSKFIKIEILSTGFQNRQTMELGLAAREYGNGTFTMLISMSIADELPSNIFPDRFH